MSNKFSKIRQLLRRPKVCKSKGRFDTITALGLCEVSPTVWEQVQFAPFSIQVKFFDELLPETEEITVRFEPGSGFNLSLDLILNDDNWWDEEVDTGNAAGVYETSIQFLLDGEIICEKDVTITVTEM